MKLFEVLKRTSGNIFYFWLLFQFLLYLKLKIQEIFQIKVGLNFKGVQTFWEKSHKFTKILTPYNLQYCEFR
jgi:hypothetical protein